MPPGKVTTIPKSKALPPPSSSSSSLSIGMPSSSPDGAHSPSVQKSTSSSSTTPTKKPASVRRRRVNLSRLPILLGVSLVSVGVYCQLSYLNAAISTSEAPRQAQQQQQALLSKKKTPKRQESLGQRIVRKAYAQTYQALEQTCPRTDELRVCMHRLSTRDHLYNPLKNTTQNYRFPWWFETMLRDGSSGVGLHGGWHDMAIVNPNVTMCSIEKIATTQWRNVFIHLNNGTGVQVRPLGLHNQPPAATTPKFVFLRDPLERFLSAYMNKCVETRRRQVEKHCEPNLLFNDTARDPKEGLLRGIVHQPRQLFAAYVDAMPFRWNVHFFPQGMYCNGLYRLLPEYDFVGHMGPHFYQDLNTVSTKYGGRLAQRIEEVFDLQSHLDSQKVFVGVQTASPKYVQEYYDGKVVRRALEYLSVDYVRLGLEIPEWAERMLREEEESESESEDEEDVEYEEEDEDDEDDDQLVAAAA